MKVAWATEETEDQVVISVAAGTDAMALVLVNTTVDVVALDSVNN
jgi:hypothetical protein